MLKLRVRISSSQVDPAMRDRIRRWLVQAEVLEVLEGQLPPDQRVVSLLVHSPARVFMDPEIVGREYVITLEDPLSEPYIGTVSVAP